jgi:hypothetical protein
MSLAPPNSVQKLQAALHAKAKGSPNYRFYALYDKVYRRDILVYAYNCCKSNKGAAGVDDQGFQDIEEYGLDRWLDELTQELKSRRYQPAAVRRVHIPKPDGKTRPLGIPTVKDRVVQMAAVLVLEPIFEADLQPEQYAYRPNSSALDAVRHVHKLLTSGHGQVVDADSPCRNYRRQHSPRRADAKRGPASLGRHPAASDQDVAGSAGGRDRRTGRKASDDPQQGPGPRDAAGRSDQPSAQ